MLARDDLSDAQARIILRRAARFFLKYTPYFVAVCYMLFCLFRGLGNDTHHVLTFFVYMGVTWAPYLLISSVAQGFCLWHRALILYGSFTGTMIYLELWFGFGPLRVFLNWLFFAIGLALVIRVTVLILQKNYCK